MNAPASMDKKELQYYLGVVNFYRRFTPTFSAKLQPLHTRLRYETKWSLTKEHAEAFKVSKELITGTPVLVHYIPEKPVVLTGDASPWGIGAVLAHEDADGQERPIAFASQRLG